MRYKPDHRQQSHAKILDAVGHGFRSHGFGGVGVDGLAKLAGLTSGAFYGHFESKAAAFREALVWGLRELRDGVAGCQAEHGAAWIEPFVVFYLGYKRTCAIGRTCALPTLSPEVERADKKTRAAYDAELLALAQTVARGLTGGDEAARLARAWMFLSLLAGGLMMSRAVQAPALARQIASAVSASACRV
jgi:AcrR family transcriptional regulator